MTDAGRRILAFDTSAGALSIALAEDGVCVAEHHEAMARGQAEALIPAIDALLAQTGWGYDALDLIAVTIGPGGFTGLRIGLAAARGLALALNIPAIGAITLEVIAAEVGELNPGTPFIAALDSKRNDWYRQLFGVDGMPRGEPGIVDGPALAAEAETLSGRIFTDRPDLLTDLTKRVDPQPVTARAANLARLVAGEAAIRTAPPYCPPEPLYLREAEARPARRRQ